MKRVPIASVLVTLQLFGKPGMELRKDEESIAEEFAEGFEGEAGDIEDEEEPEPER
ncbi:MAG: hypothetical protein IT429_03010 [Gemmataceae bacterium]|nr:hypothetical protein [Gemmataceae bacterium]